MAGEELARSLESGARMALPQVVRVMEQLLAALSYAHDAGVVHRDIKPSTETGTLLGTPAYMSPEQFLGVPVASRFLRSSATSSGRIRSFRS